MVELRIGESLAYHRKRKGYTLRKLGELAGVPYETIHRLESGKVSGIRLETACKLADALQITLDELAGRDADTWAATLDTVSA